VLIAADDDGDVAAALALHRRERAYRRAGKPGAPIGPVERAPWGRQLGIFHRTNYPDALRFY
jgi:hypothetical protein